MGCGASAKHQPLRFEEADAHGIDDVGSSPPGNPAAASSSSKYLVEDRQQSQSDVCVPEAHIGLPVNPEGVPQPIGAPPLLHNAETIMGSNTCSPLWKPPHPCQGPSNAAAQSRIISHTHYAPVAGYAPAASRTINKSLASTPIQGAIPQQKNTSVINPIAVSAATEALQNIRASYTQPAPIKNGANCHYDDGTDDFGGSEWQVFRNEQWAITRIAEREELAQNTAGATAPENVAAGDGADRGFENDIEADLDAQEAWAGIGNLVLTYVPNDRQAAQDRMSGDFDAQPVSSAGGNSLVGPAMTTDSAYGLLLEWQRRHVGVQPASQRLLDPRRLVQLRNHALQIAELDGLLTAKFDDTSVVHRRLAFSVYAKFVRLNDSRAQPVSCPRYCSQWLDMGFQREDFATDLRGVGILGLLHLHYFFASFPSLARKAQATNASRVLRHGPNGAVPLACVSLNMSSLAILALRDGQLSRLCRQAKSVHSAVLKIHSVLMAGFVHKWQSDPEATVTSFDSIFKGLKEALRKSQAQLRRTLVESVSADERVAAEKFILIRVQREEEVTPPEANLVNRVVAATKGQSLQSSGTLDFDEARLVLSRACSTSPQNDVERIFRLICRGSVADQPLSSIVATQADLAFFCSALGYGHTEAERFVQLVDVNADGVVDFPEFQLGYKRLNSYRIYKRSYETILRKPNSMNGQQLALEDLVACEVQVLDHIGASFVDSCRDSQIVIGPASASVFVRDCADCTFYVAVQQLRTRNCVRCTFFLYSATEPIIETSSQLVLAPLALAYPGLAVQLQAAGLNAQRNLWNAVFDFSSPEDCNRNWTRAELNDCCQCCIALSSGNIEGNNVGANIEIHPSGNDALVFPAVTHEVLWAAPIISGHDTGRRVDLAGPSFLLR